MKNLFKNLFILCFIILYTGCNKHIVNIKKKKLGKEITLITDPPEFLYSIIPIPYRLKNVDSSEVRAFTKNMKFSLENSYFNIGCWDALSKGELIIVNKNNEVIFNKTFFAIPPPIDVRISPFSSGCIIDYTRFLNSKLDAQVMNFGIDLHFSIKSFVMSFSMNDSLYHINNEIDWCYYNYYTYRDENCKFYSDELLKHIKEFKDNQIVIFSDIIVKVGEHNYKKIDYNLVYYINRNDSI